MSAARPSFGLALGMAGAAALTTWVAMTSWRGFTEGPEEFLRPLFWIGLLVAVAGALARWARVPRPLVPVLQVVVSVPAVCLAVTGSPLPSAATWTELTAAVEVSLDVANRFAPPVPTDGGGIHPLLVLCGWPCLLLVDLLACTLRRVSLAGLPLLAIYSVPIGLLGGGVSWWLFALTAGGFLLLLQLHHADELRHWGRGLAPGRDQSRAPAAAVRTNGVRAGAGTIGGLATGLAVVVPVFVPTVGVHVFDLGHGGGGDSTVSIENPMTDLVRDLIRGENVPLLRVVTEDPRPDYLRIAVLKRFSGEEWSAGERQLPTDQTADGPLPSLQGVDADLPRRSWTYGVQVLESFDSTWLPTQSQITRIRAEGDWRYDETTMDFLAMDEDLNAAGLGYTMTAVELELAADALADAPAAGGDIDLEYTELPVELPPVVRDLATEVTRSAATRFEKAVALQQWFRSDGGFTYDLRPAADGNGTDALVRFLSDDEQGRTGYCEQFASAMAVMARTLGIPARVAVGFLEPEPIGPTTWEYSAHDMHAWPELYFPGSGWVRFEPTPAGRAEGVPSYTTELVPGLGPGAGPDAGPSGAPTTDRVPLGPQATLLPENTGAVAAPEQGEEGFPWVATAAVLVPLALLVVAALWPRVRRGRLRQQRMHGGAEEAWGELRATAIDLGVDWPEGRSPRATRDRLVGAFGRPVDDLTPARPAHGPDQAPDAVLAVDRIVAALERLRYSRSGDPGVPSLSAEVGTCIAALEGGATPRARRLAAWWPRSVLPARRRLRSVQRPVETPHGGVVDHVG